MPRREGQFIVEDFFVNTGGLNTSDSPFVIQNDEATGGMNFDYVKRGGIQKRGGHTKLNAVANAQLRSLGLGLYNKPDTGRTVIRAAGTKLQAFDPTAYTFTNLTEDSTAAGSDFLPGTSTQPVVSTMFNTASAGVLWQAGGGMSKVYGAYSATKATENGVPAPTASSFTGTPGGSGGTLAVGSYYYSLVFRKASTQALSNAGAETAQITITAGQKVTLAWTLTNNDTTKYDKIYVYRSSVGGAAGFTAGALVATLASSATGYVDDGTVVSSSESVPRVNNVILDNSPLQTGVGNYTTLCVFKRRLVTSYGTTVCFSDLNKPESWPTYQRITIPSGGNITGLATISFITPTSSSTDELLCVFKQTELWVISGDGTISSGLPDWALKQIDNSGASNQAVIVAANGFLAWLNYRGGFIWNGSDKPVYMTPSIEDKFQRAGDIDKSKLGEACGCFVQSRNEIQWYVSSSTEGEQQYVLKLDLRLTAEGYSTQSGNRILRGKFTPDVTAFPVYACLPLIKAGDSIEENLYLGDAAGFVYDAYTGVKDGATAVPFEYYTPFLNLGQPGVAKRVNKVVVWILDNGVYDLQLDFWANYRYLPADASSRVLPSSPQAQGSGLVWDVGKWDETLWDSVNNSIRPLTFNLASLANNSEGDAVRLRLYQADTDYQVTVYGFSVYYQEIALRH